MSGKTGVIARTQAIVRGGFKGDDALGTGNNPWARTTAVAQASTN